MVYYSFQRSHKWGILASLALKQEAVRNLPTLILWAALGKLLLLLYWRCCFAACSHQGYSKTAFIKCLLWECSFRTIFQEAVPARPFLHKHFCTECVLVQLTTHVNKEKDRSRLLLDVKLQSWFCPPGNSFLFWHFFIFPLSVVINA